MNKIDKKMIAIISLLIAMIIIWIIIFILLYMDIYTLFIAVLVAISAVLTIIESRLLSAWNNKKGGWIILVLGSVALSATLIVGYSILTR